MKFVIYFTYCTQDRLQTNLNQGKTDGQKQENQARLDKTRKYLLLVKFLPILPKINFWKDTEHYPVPSPNFEIFFSFPYFLSCLETCEATRI